MSTLNTPKGCGRPAVDRRRCRVCNRATVTEPGPVGTRFTTHYRALANGVVAKCPGSLRPIK